MSRRIWTNGDGGPRAHAHKSRDRLRAERDRQTAEVSVQLTAKARIERIGRAARSPGRRRHLWESGGAFRIAHRGARAHARSIWAVSRAVLPRPTQRALCGARYRLEA